MGVLETNLLSPDDYLFMSVPADVSRPSRTDAGIPEAKSRLLLTDVLRIYEALAERSFALHGTALQIRSYTKLNADVWIPILSKEIWVDKLRRSVESLKYKGTYACLADEKYPVGLVKVEHALDSSVQKYNGGFLRYFSAPYSSVQTGRSGCVNPSVYAFAAFFGMTLANTEGWLGGFPGPGDVPTYGRKIARSPFAAVCRATRLAETANPENQWLYVSETAVDGSSSMSRSALDGATVSLPKLKPGITMLRMMAPNTLTLFPGNSDAVRSEYAAPVMPPVGFVSGQESDSGGPGMGSDPDPEWAPDTGSDGDGPGSDGDGPGSDGKTAQTTYGYTSEYANIVTGLRNTYSGGYTTRYSGPWTGNRLWKIDTQYTGDLHAGDTVPKVSGVTAIPDLSSVDTFGRQFYYREERCYIHRVAYVRHRVTYHPGTEEHDGYWTASNLDGGQATVVDDEIEKSTYEFEFSNAKAQVTVLPRHLKFPLRIGVDPAGAEFDYMKEHPVRYFRRFLGESASVLTGTTYWTYYSDAEDSATLGPHGAYVQCTPISSAQWVGRTADSEIELGLRGTLDAGDVTQKAKDDIDRFRDGFDAESLARASLSKWSHSALPSAPGSSAHMDAGGLVARDYLGPGETPPLGNWTKTFSVSTSVTTCVHCEIGVGTLDVTAIPARFHANISVK